MRACCESARCRPGTVRMTSWRWMLAGAGLADHLFDAVQGLAEPVGECAVWRRPAPGVRTAWARARRHLPGIPSPGCAARQAAQNLPRPGIGNTGRAMPGLRQWRGSGASGPGVHFPLSLPGRAGVFSPPRTRGRLHGLRPRG
jgi:hypothetical protein